MVDVSAKNETGREAVARAAVQMRPETLQAIEEGSVKKGNVLAVARVAGIMAAKKTGGLIPLCHPIELTDVDIDFKSNPAQGVVEIEARTRAIGRTGVEMEAMVAVSVAALTIYDMCKSADRDILITDVRLIRKSGGKSGVYERNGVRRND